MRHYALKLECSTNWEFQHLSNKPSMCEVWDFRVPLSVFVQRQICNNFLSSDGHVADHTQTIQQGERNVVIHDRNLFQARLNRDCTKKAWPFCHDELDLSRFEFCTCQSSSVIHILIRFDPRFGPDSSVCLCCPTLFSTRSSSSSTQDRVVTLTVNSLR